MPETRSSRTKFCEDSNVQARLRTFIVLQVLNFLENMKLLARSFRQNL